MALLPIHKYFVFNDQIWPVEKFLPSENEGGVYEVVRVVEGVPLFWEDHMQRFQQSALLAGKDIPYESAKIHELISELILKDKVQYGNILISVKTNLKAFFIPHRYPDKMQYKNGVECGLLFAERSNPNAKVFQTNVRQEANRLMANNLYYEVLLIDHNKCITEGSRSNLFFIKGKELITPPAQQVLVGITRQKTIECAKEMKCRVVEREIKLTELEDFDCGFITGTSPKVLPISRVNGVEYELNNKRLRGLMDSYDQMIINYIKNA